MPTRDHAHLNLRERLSSSPHLLSKTISHVNHLSVQIRKVSGLTDQPRLKHELEHGLHSDAADRLHLGCCGSQKITESRLALLHVEWLRKLSAEPPPAPGKVDTILNFLPSVQIPIQYTACMCLKTCLKKPLSIVVIIRDVCFH